MLALLLVPLASCTIYFKETFDSSSHPFITPDRSDLGKWSVEPGKFYANEKASQGLKTTEDYRFYAASAAFDTEFNHKDHTFILGYTVKFEQQIDCGGGYVKIIPPGFKPVDFNGETTYNIMFGPDKCGPSSKTHLILNSKDVNHECNKKHSPVTDQLTHVYKLVLDKDFGYKVSIDGDVKMEGDLSDWDILGPETIPDPKASKPKDWVDDELIDDPEDVKPTDLEPEMIPDETAEKPEEWDDEMDGEWEPAMVPNPAFTGPWTPKRIKNPEYKGKWVHPKIPNPDYTGEKPKYVSAFIGFDLWQVKSGTIFDNIIVTDSEEEYTQFINETFSSADAELERDAKAAFDKEEEEKLKSEEKEESAEEVVVDAGESGGDDEKVEEVKEVPEDKDHDEL